MFGWRRHWRTQERYRKRNVWECSLCKKTEPPQLDIETLPVWIFWLEPRFQSCCKSCFLLVLQIYMKFPWGFYAAFLWCNQTFLCITFLNTNSKVIPRLLYLMSRRTNNEVIYPYFSLNRSTFSSLMLESICVTKMWPTCHATVCCAPFTIQFTTHQLYRLGSNQSLIWSLRTCSQKLMEIAKYRRAIVVVLHTGRAFRLQCWSSKNAVLDQSWRSVPLSCLPAGYAAVYAVE